MGALWWLVRSCLLWTVTVPKQAWMTDLIAVAKHTSQIQIYGSLNASLYRDIAYDLMKESCVWQQAGRKRQKVTISAVQTAYITGYSHITPAIESHLHEAL